MTRVPWPLACDFDRSADLQVAMPPLVLSTKKLWSGNYLGCHVPFLSLRASPYAAASERSRMRTESIGAWHASDDGRITALFTPRCFPVRDMTADTNRNCAPEAYSRTWDQLRSGETSAGRAASLGGISAVFGHLDRDYSARSLSLDRE